VLKSFEQACEQLGMEFNLMETTFFLSRETVVVSASEKRIPMPLWRTLIFVGLLKNARGATDFFKLPTNRVIEIGCQINL
jgi:KUP system potassium uptake protein